MLTIPPHVAARLRLLRTRAALPALLPIALLTIGNAEDLITGTRLAWQALQSVPGLRWLASPIGMLLLSIAWLIWLIVRPPHAVERLERVERLRVLLREAASAMRGEDAGADAAAMAGRLAGGYAFVLGLDFLDDAFVERVRLDFEAFKEREHRMYSAADVPDGGVKLSADYFEWLSNHITPADVDPGFRMPLSFAEWSEHHQPNIRPVNWQATRSRSTPWML